VNGEDLRAFANRDWAAAADAKLDYWAESFHREGAGPARRASTLLLEHARRIGVSLLDEADRAADLAHHAAQRERLDRAARAFTGR
jgi:hypothetical protein